MMMIGRVGAPTMKCDIEKGGDVVWVCDGYDWPEKTHRRQVVGW